MVWPADISLETLPILDTRGLPLHFRPARVQVLGSPLNQKEGQARRGSKPEQEFNYQIRSDEYMNTRAAPNPDGGKSYIRSLGAGLVLSSSARDLFTVLDTALH